MRLSQTAPPSRLGVTLAGVSEEVIDGEVVEEAEDGREVSEARVRTVSPHRSAEVERWRGDVRNAAVAAASGLAAGAATVLAVAALRDRQTRKLPTRLGRRRKDDGILASRSFLIDVHVLGR